MRVWFQFIEREKLHTKLRKFDTLTAFFENISPKISKNFILKNSRKNCLNLDSRSRLEAEYWKTEILALFSKHEIER